MKISHSQVWTRTRNSVPFVNSLQFHFTWGRVISVDAGHWAEGGRELESGEWDV